MKNQKGFSLVELMMTAAIMGMLASMAVVSYNGIRDRVKMDLVRSQLKNYSSFIQAARLADPTELYIMTGNPWTDLGFDDSTPMHLQAAAVATNNTSWNKLTGGQEGAPIDPWGNPLTIDENEHVAGLTDCRYDILASAGPDGILDGWSNPLSDDLYVAVPHAFCTSGPTPDNTGTQW